MLDASRLEIIVNKRIEQRLEKWWNLAKQTSVYCCLSACHMCFCWPDGHVSSLMKSKKILSVWHLPFESLFNMLLSVNSFIVLITFASLTTAKFSGQRHHKVRHKHNTFNLRGKHVNDIREAFDQYRSVLRHTSKQGKLLEYPEIKDVGLSDEYDDTIDNNVKSNSWEPSRRDATRHKVTASFNHNHQPSKYVPPTSNDYFPRNKRIFTTTSTTTPRTTTTSRSNDNYDYYEDDNDASNRRLNDDAQVGSARYNRDVSFLGAELIKVKLSESSILWSLNVIMLLISWFLFLRLERDSRRTLFHWRLFSLRLTWVVLKLS